MLVFLSSASVDFLSSGGSIKDFVVYFYSFFIAPIFRILRDTVVLGYPLFNWVFGFTFIALAVKFFRAFFPSGNDDK